MKKKEKESAKTQEIPLEVPSAEAKEVKAEAVKKKTPASAEAEVTPEAETPSPEERDRVKEARVVLRRVQEHLFQAHSNLGGQQETIGLVEALYHPQNALADLNYVTPRRNTAWVPGNNIEQGLERLRTLGRSPRVQYIEGLFPPPFAKTIRALDLQVERETPIMASHLDETKAAPSPLIPEGVTVEQVNDQRGISLWWYVWRNAFYDVMTLGVEPLFVGRDMAELKLGHQIDILAYRRGFPVGVARVTVQNDTAHLVGLALMKEVRTPEMMRAVQAAAIRAAREHHCTLIFAPGETEEDRRLCRELGFMDYGSIVCYAAPADQADEEPHDDTLAQPVLSLR